MKKDTQQGFARYNTAPSSARYSLVSGFAPIVLLVALLIISGLFGAYYLGKQTNKPVITQTTPTYYQPPTSSPTQQLTTSPTTATKMDETANWKTYTNSVYGIQFKYPPSWQIQEGKYYGGITASSVDVMNIDSIDDKGIFIVAIQENNFSYPSVNKWLQKQIDDCKNQGCAPSPPKFLENTSIDNNLGIKTDYPLPGPLSGKATSYFISHNKKLYEIRFEFGFEEGDSKNQSLESIFNQILSTFHFTQ